MKTVTTLPLLIASLIAAVTAGLIAHSARTGAEFDAPDQEQQDWPVYGGAPENNHYSTLAQINRSNVKHLTVAWSFDKQEEGGLQTSPIIVFFFQAEDGIRDYKVTGVQTCALPI